MEKLPELPLWVRTLSNPESDWVQGHFALSSDWRLSCNTCRGKTVFRFYSEGDPRKPVVDWECNCLDQWILNRYFTWHGIGESYQRMSLSDAEPLVTSNPSIWEVFDWATDDLTYASGRGLVIRGGHGTGKTLLSSLVARLAMSRGVKTYSVRFADWTNLIHGDDEEKAWRLGILRHADLLIVDDLGTEHTRPHYVKDEGVGESTTPWVKSQWEAFIRGRTQELKSTVVTTNLTQAAVTKRYGDSVGELMRERSMWYEVSGDSWRDQAKARTDKEIIEGIRRPVMLT